MKIPHPSGLAVVSPGRFNLEKVTPIRASKEKSLVIALLRIHRQLLYNPWNDYCIIPQDPVVTDYANETEKDIIGNGRCVGICSEDLYGVLFDSVEGTPTLWRYNNEKTKLYDLEIPALDRSWNLTIIETILRFENSGLKVFLYGNRDYKLQNPSEYMDGIRQYLAELQLALANARRDLLDFCQRALERVRTQFDGVELDAMTVIEIVHKELSKEPLYRVWKNVPDYPSSNDYMEKNIGGHTIRIFVEQPTHYGKGWDVVVRIKE